MRIAAPGGAEGQTPPRPALLEWSMALDFEETLGHAGALVRHPNGALEGGFDPRGDGCVAGF